jgi:hypothetical protein
MESVAVIAIVIAIVLIMLYWFSSSGSSNVTDINIMHPLNWLHFGEVEIWGKDGKKIPLAGAKATQSSLWKNKKQMGGQRLIDGNRKSINHSGKKGIKKIPQWVNLKLKEPVDASKIDKVVVYNRPGGVGSRAKGAVITVLSGAVPLKTHVVTKNKPSYTLKL